MLKLFSFLIMKFGIVLLIVFLSIVFCIRTEANIVDSGNEFKLSFNLSDQNPAPPYTSFIAQLHFSESDKFDIGEGFKAQSFDSDNIASSNQLTVNNSIKSTLVYSIGSPFLSPSDGIGNIFFTEIVGSFDLLSAQIKAYINNTESTDFVNTELVITNVPIPSAVWLLGSGLIGIVGIRRKLKK